MFIIPLVSAVLFVFVRHLYSVMYVTKFHRAYLFEVVENKCVLNLIALLSLNKCVSNLLVLLLLNKRVLNLLFLILLNKHVFFSLDHVIIHVNLYLHVFDELENSYDHI